MESRTWLEDLQEEYARSLPSKFATLRVLTEEVAARPSDTEALRALARGIDRLVGSAGSYGFPQITETLSPWARVLLFASAAGRAPGPADVERLRAAVATAEEAGAFREKLGRVPALPPTRVMLVEDDPSIRRVICDSLAGPWSLSVHGDGSLALAALAGELPDILLLDLCLPGIDGPSLLRAVRADARLRHLPVIALTCLADPADRERLLAAGFDGLVTKPITDASVLASTLEECLTGR